MSIGPGTQSPSPVPSQWLVSVNDEPLLAQVPGAHTVDEP